MKATWQANKNTDTEIISQRQNPANFPEESRDYTDVEERKMEEKFFFSGSVCPVGDRKPALSNHSQMQRHICLVGGK